MSDRKQSSASEKVDATFDNPAILDEGKGATAQSMLEPDDGGGHQVLRGDDYSTPRMQPQPVHAMKGRRVSHILHEMAAKTPDELLLL
ncbi:hypothetical protein BJX68DRAFT_229198 [Aspergillus pseudodeflectus]|uniref:Uncharacterized protein n=1 Tax=Aspergillus pseudodeflectus TaxID=176178 RepID=A0ABR4L2A3_9EURO